MPEIKMQLLLLWLYAKLQLIRLPFLRTDIVWNMVRLSTLCEQMNKLFETYGFYKEDLCTITLKGQNGAKQIAAIMEKIRKEVPTELGGSEVLALRDYELGIVKNPKTGEENGTGLPKSNVLYFELENDAWCCVRPSGTEPKIKFYVGVRGTDSEDAEEKMNTLMCGVRALAEEE